MPHTRSAFSKVELNGLVFTIGGLDSNPGPTEAMPSNACDIFDPKTNIWQFGPPLNDARSGHGIFVYGNRIYVAGGRGLDGPLSSVEVYDPGTHSWHLLAPLPSPQAHVRIANFGVPNLLHVVASRTYLYHINFNWWEVPKLVKPYGFDGIDRDDEADQQLAIKPKDPRLVLHSKVGVYSSS